jgi:glutamine amidotransferase
VAYESSQEAPELEGLGVLAGACARLVGGERTGPSAAGVKVPHVGWNSLSLRRDAWISRGVADGSQVYFTHSYVAPITADAVAVTTHGEPFAAMAERGSVAGVQFHPEKSGDVGLRVLRNFVELTG